MANVVPFSLLSVDQPAIGNTGPATLELRGSKLDSATSFTLTGPGGATITGSNPLTVDSTDVFVTFNAASAALGSYTLTAKDAGGDVVSLPGSVQVVAGTSPQVSMNVSMPATVLPNGVFDGQIIVRNTGNVDTSPPILHLDTSGTGLIGLSSSALAGTTLDLLVRSPTGPGEILRPGESITVTVFLQELAPANSQVTLQATALTASANPVDLNAALAAAQIPPGTFAGEPDLLTLLQAVVGPTDASYLSALQFTVSGLDGRGNFGMTSLPLITAWDDELAMVYQLFNTGLLPQIEGDVSGASVAEAATATNVVTAQAGPVYSLPPGQTVQISTVQQGTPGGPVYYVTSGFTAAQSYDLSDPNDSVGNMVNAINAWTGMMNGSNPDGNAPTPTIKVVNWASGTNAGLAASTLADAAEGGELGSELGPFGTLGGALGGAYAGGIGYYNQASANVPAVGQAIANDIAGNDYAPGGVTLIGHSLGAQASIFAGLDYQQLTGQQLGTIQALDPAGPGFPVSGQYADAGAAQTVNTYNTSPTFGEWDNMVGTPGHNYYPDLPPGTNNPVDQHSYAYTYYAMQLGMCNPDPMPNPDMVPPRNFLPGLLGGLVRAGATTVQRPHDPNAIVGPAGFGDQHFVTVGTPLQYEVLFENEATANGPAHSVTITDQLDPNLDPGSFRLGSFGWGGMTFQVPANLSFYQTTIDLTKQSGFDVEVTGTIDERTAIATWVFQTIDPATGECPPIPASGSCRPTIVRASAKGSCRTRWWRRPLTRPVR